ncbi:hypothetical protein FA95DRAFT_1189199 [Auriscalpium vulgare]|uniref:Uncharacterized protein n=1 Tax=Auriscalpium vulgare TaxID=40419 RepID=A0ACB8RVW5_9AGAM|nr:hypothetical protein FA95DRAFT_1189199 [Auriscalpium vulgare]
MRAALALIGLYLGPIMPFSSALRRPDWSSSVCLQHVHHRGHDHRAKDAITPLFTVRTLDLLSGSRRLTRTYEPESSKYQKEPFKSLGAVV